MIEKIISWSTHNRFFVWSGILLIVIGGIFAVATTPVDAIRDLSENQVIIYTEWMGRNPKIIEDQITYPLVSNLQGIPNIKSIRASSMFGMSFVFVIFKDDIEIYWATIENKSFVEILSGVSEGERVVKTGAYLLNSEFILKRGAVKAHSH